MRPKSVLRTGSWLLLCPIADRSRSELFGSFERAKEIQKKPKEASLASKGFFVSKPEELSYNLSSPPLAPALSQSSQEKISLATLRELLRKPEELSLATLRELLWAF